MYVVSLRNVADSRGLPIGNWSIFSYEEGMVRSNSAIAVTILKRPPMLCDFGVHGPLPKYSGGSTRSDRPK